MTRSRSRGLCVLLASLVMVSALAFGAASASAATPHTSNGRPVSMGTAVAPQSIYGPYLWNYYDTVTECDNYG